MSLWNKNIDHEQNFIFYHYYNSWLFFLLVFLIKKYPKVTSVKKTTYQSWTNHFGHVLCDWAIKLDLAILTSKVIDQMTDYSIGK
jgi:hypothetical protein